MIDSEKSVYNWRGRVIPTIDFLIWISIIDVDFENEIANVGAPHLYITSETSYETSKIEGPFWPFFPCEEAQSGSLLTSSDSSISSFIPQSTPSLLHWNFHGAPSADAERQVCFFVVKTLILHQRFDICCKQEVCYRKKNIQVKFSLQL